MPTNYKTLLNAEVAKLQALLGRRKDLKNELSKTNSEIFRLREGVIGLAALAGVNLKMKNPELFTEPYKADIGLTDTIRDILKNTDCPMTPTEIRDEVFDRGFPIHQHKNPLASIHSILKRLADAGQVVIATETDTKKTVYLWADSYEASKLLLEDEKVDSDEDVEEEYIVEE